MSRGLSALTAREKANMAQGKSTEPLRYSRAQPWFLGKLLPSHTPYLPTQGF